jgi:apolipoprotein D and lipocalin family protein
MPHSLPDLRIRRAPVFLAWVSCLVLLAGCDTGIPDGVDPVTGLDAERYLGTWYSIARLDHSFERGLTQVTAEYTMRDDGTIRVVNRGYDPEEGEWEEAVGRARFMEGDTVGRLRVSFFRPFWGGYNIIALDREGYEYAMVSGPDRSYLWILARHPDLDPVIADSLVQKARELEFPVDELTWIEHGPIP